MSKQLSSMRHLRQVSWLTLAALLFVFSLYTNPDLYVSVSNLFWSCFGAI